MPAIAPSARYTLLLAVSMISTAYATPCLAQRGAADDAALRARMDAFLEVLPYAEPESVAVFFPRRGDWTWVQTWRERGGGDSVGVWRFPASATVKVIARGGPACQAFDAGPGDIGFAYPSLAAVALRRPEGWRRVGGTRFVPRGASARSPTWVEWRREDGAWVVSAIGDEHAYSPRLLGREVGTISPDTSLVPEGAAYAAGEAWYEHNEPITFGGLRYVKNSPPMAISTADQRYLERVGVKGRVSVYAERAAPGTVFREVLYLPVSPGVYQPYMGFGALPCR